MEEDNGALQSKDLVDEIATVSLYPTGQIDALWIDKRPISGLWWCLVDNKMPSLARLIEYMQSLSPLQTELDGLIQTMSCLIEKSRSKFFSMTFETDIFDLIKVIENQVDWLSF